MQKYKQLKKDIETKSNLNVWNRMFLLVQENKLQLNNKTSVRMYVFNNIDFKSKQSYHMAWSEQIYEWIKTKKKLVP